MKDDTTFERGRWPEVVAIVLNWNGRTIRYNSKSILESCLSTLTKTDYGNLRIIVVDAESTDDSVAFTKKHYKVVDILSVENRGWAYGNNIAIKFAFKKYPNARYFVVLNNDLIFDDRRWLKKMIVATEHNSAELCGCQLVYPDGKVQFGGGRISALGIKFTKDKATSSKSRFTPILTGAVLLVKREVFLKIGYFDETFLPFNWEDAEFVTRAQKAEFNSYYVGNTKIEHLESFTINSSDTKNRWSNEMIVRATRRNGYIYYLRYRRYLLPFYFVADFISNFVALNPNLCLREWETIRIRLKTQLSAFSAALKSFKEYKTK